MGMLRRMTAATAIGEGLDGFDLGIIAVVLPLITAALGLTPVWSGLIAAGSTSPRDRRPLPRRR